MALPKERSSKVTDIFRQVILVYGAPKIGKSTFCSQIPNVLFIATESGLNYLEVFKAECRSWEDFLGICKEIAEGKHKFTSICIDTIDNLVIQCTEFICRREEIDHPADYEYGKGWSMVTRELQRALNKLANLPYGLVLVGHSKMEEIKPKAGSSYNKQTITVTGENRRIILNLADVILLLDYEDEKDKETRVIRTKSTKQYDAGDRTGRLPPILNLDYKEIEKYFI